MLTNLLDVPEEFENALRKGLGRAVGHVRAARAESVRQPLLHACINYVGYDLQCEGSRVPWLYKMITLTGEPDWYCAALLETLEMIQDIPEDSRGLEEMLELLAVFVQKGHTEVRDILLGKIFSFKSGEGLFGCDIPIDVLGVDGVVEVLRRYSRLREYSLSLGYYLLDDAVQEFGPSATEAVQMAGRDDEILRTYLLEVEEDRRKDEEEILAYQALPSEPPEPYLPPEEVLFSRLDSLPRESGYVNDVPPEMSMIWRCQEDYFSLRNSFRHASTWRNRRYVATPEFLERVFARLMAENDSGKQFCLLGAFHYTAMPRFEPSILDLVDSPVEALRDQAANALSNMSVPEIRAKGRELLKAMAEREDWANGFLLLNGSGRAEDLPLIVDSLNAVSLRTMAASAVHNIVWNVIPLARIGNPIDAAPIMLWVYENSPCANCRGKSVSWLVENNVAPEALLMECLDDCDEYICEIAQKSLA